MSDLIDDHDNEDAKKKKRGESGGNFGDGNSGLIQASGEEDKKKKQGESDGSFGDGKAGAGAGIGFLLSTKKDEQVKGERRHLTAGDLMDAIVEFFSELPMRASANVVVTWEKTKTNMKSFAIVNWIIDFADKSVREFARTRQLRDTRSLQKQKGPANNLGLSMGPLGPTGQ